MTLLLAYREYKKVKRNKLVAFNASPVTSVLYPLFACPILHFAVKVVLCSNSEFVKITVNIVIVLQILFSNSEIER